MKYAKFWIAIATAALTGVVGILPVDSTATQWIILVLTVLGAFAVLRVPNSSAARSALTADERRHQL